MEAWFTRLLDFMNLKVCSKPHIQGLMHWFTCVPDMDFQYILDVIEHGNPCKYWAPKGKACPALSSECYGRHCSGPLPAEPEDEEPPEVQESNITQATVSEDDTSIDSVASADDTDAEWMIDQGTTVNPPRRVPMRRIVTTTLTTTISPCEGDVELAFWNSAVVHSNLNNLGPHFNKTEGIRVSDLGTWNGQSFDMLIESTSDRYTSNWAHWNGVYGYFGYLTTNVGEGMDLRFTIVESGTTTPFVLPKFYFSFFDLDTANGDTSGIPKKGAEEITVGGYYQYILGPNTELQIVDTADGRKAFRAQVYGDSLDNPNDPQNMTEPQMNRAITLEFRDTASFEASYQVLEGAIGKGREVYFAGKSELAYLPCRNADEE
jgi:hypothetical protein